ncbi:MAG: GNAT family protein [Candidatus Sulfotelmatobacter sp.]
MTAPSALTLETARLKLRPYSNADIAQLLPLIGAREVAATTLRIPHPYTEKDAREFIAASQNESECRLAITLRSDGQLIGGVGLRMAPQHQNAELGYWLGVPYWEKGYATEAAREMLRYGFEELHLHRIFASHFNNNPASGRILKKLGMHYEGCQREHLRKWDQFLDSELYGMLRRDWNAAK